RRATDLNSDMWDAVQEEVCTVIEAAGIPLSKGEHTQLHAAIGRLIDEQVKTRLEKNQNGADIQNKPLFIENLGLKETLNPTKRVSIGNIGTGAFDGSTPSINIGDSDSGFIGSADGVIDIYCNNAKVGYIDNAGLHMLAGIATNSDVVLQSDARRHIIIQNADGSVRAYIYKDKGDTGIHINNGVDGAGDFIFGKDSILYVPYAVRAGGSKKLAIQSDNNSALDAMFNLWGRPERPTVIELDDDQGWHLYSQRNPDGSILFTVNGDIMANRKLNVGAATISSDGNINGSLWGGWLNDWINNTIINRFVQDVRLGGIEYAQAWNGPGFNDTPGYVITGVTNSNGDELIDGVHRRPLQKLIGGVWYNVASI
ncbi:TPA: phage tail protein, partial [Salmonella enterica]